MFRAVSSYQVLCFFLVGVDPVFVTLSYQLVAEVAERMEQVLQMSFNISLYSEIFWLIQFME
jgi:hypothetical protein